MATRMLIDASHPEETRVAVVAGSRIEEFDFEAEAHKQIRGNIYLAKITRVEPSLQAAFVDYGGNRHGFLAFSEIHPDYYQIPKEDREALLREEQQIAEEQVEADDEAAEKAATGSDGDGENGNGGPTEAGGSSHAGTHGPDPDDPSAEGLRRRRMALRRRYKIQEVIRRRQVMLVQVVKEERGNKGAALTTYISLAGRYSVLMPNTAQGGGISRKISNSADRKRLKKIISELNLPVTMGAIVRTAGLQRTKTEIKRDFDYLARLWDEIRDKTLASTAPALIYEDSDLVKRAIRDIYHREIEEVLVDGAEGYTQAKNFMRLLMPSHARRVKAYTEAVPLFQRAGVERQLTELLDPVVTLKSGGYLVINPTEALVSIDVNSGRSTREYNIEETALKTNLEAAQEVARQLRLRDLAGLIVVDFIDMESHGNNRKVERALKDALKQDRARIQVGRISSFGLLEMSRQRLRTSILEASTHVCPTCEGLGLVRTEGSAALAALRQLEEEAVKARASVFLLKADLPVAVYIWNNKRAEIAELEARYGVTVLVEPDAALAGGRCTVEASGRAPANASEIAELAAALPGTEPTAKDKGRSAEQADEKKSDDKKADDKKQADDQERSGRRRRGGRRNGRSRDEQAEEQTAETDDEQTTESKAAAEDQDDKSGNRKGRRRGGQRRRSSRSDDAQSTAEEAAEQDTDQPETEVAEPASQPQQADAEVVTSDASDTADEAAESAEVEDKAESKAPARRRRRPAAKKTETKADDAAEDEAGDKAADDVADDADAPDAEEKPVRRPRRRRKAEEAVADAVEAEPVAEAEPAEEAPAEVSAAKEAEDATPAPAETVADSAAEADASGEEDAGEAEAEAPRRGWWQRTFGN